MAAMPRPVRTAMLRGASRRWRGAWRHRRDVDVARDADANNTKRIKDAARAQDLGHVVHRVLRRQAGREVAELGVPRVERAARDAHGQGDGHGVLRGELELDEVDDREEGAARAADPELEERRRRRVEVVGHHLGRHGEHLEACADVRRRPGGSAALGFRHRAGITSNEGTSRDAAGGPYMPMTAQKILMKSSGSTTAMVMERGVWVIRVCAGPPSVTPLR
jgi:hypothetical protein